MTTTTHPPAEEHALDPTGWSSWEPASPPDASFSVDPGRPSLARRVVRGRLEDPQWVRPALLVLLAATAALYLWDLGASGWANSFYSAAVQAGTKSWKAFFFGSSDASNFITVDKPPASLWVMEISARIFGVSSWSILVPQALEGVAAVALVHATVRRWFSPIAALAAGAAMALTPVAVLMFRFNNPDALLVLLLCAAAYALTLAIEKASTRWVVTAFALVGVGFITKMMQAFLVVPAFGVAYLVASPAPFARRVRQLAWGALAMVVSSGWWVAAATLTPAADRPYVGGSQNNSILNLIFGYNGFGRITGDETGSVGGRTGAAGGAWGPTGIFRLLGSDMGTQTSWLLPVALVLLVACAVLTLRARRTDRTRAALILWGGWLLVTAVVFSFSKGIIHPYYTVALAPATAALVGIGGTTMWSRRKSWPIRIILAGTVLGTAVWSYVLLDRTPTWNPALRWLVLISGSVATVALMRPPAGRGPGWRARIGGATLVGLIGLAALGGPAAYALSTAGTPHTGAIPSAGPAGASGSAGGPPGGGGPGRAGGPAGLGRFNRTGPNGTGPNGAAFGPPGGGFGGVAAPGQLPPGAGFGAPGTITPGSGGFPSGGGAGGGPGGGGPRVGGPGGAGGLLNGSTSNTALTAALRANSSRYTWAAAAVGANEAAGYQLASREPVMAIGGFNGTDPWPTLAVFERYVGAHKIHYFIAGGGFGGPGGSSSSDSSAITTWVESHFTAQTIGGLTVYDLTVTTAGA